MGIIRNRCEFGQVLKNGAKADKGYSRLTAEYPENNLIVSGETETDHAGEYSGEG